MADVIDNPILNAPYRMPTRYFRVDDDRIAWADSRGRRPSSFVVPVVQPKEGLAAQRTLADEGWITEVIYCWAAVPERTGAIA